MALVPGDGYGTRKLVLHGVAAGDVVEEYVSLHRRHPPLLRNGMRDGFVGGAAVEEKQPARADLFHQQIHRLGVLSKQAAGVVVHADNVRHRLDRCGERSAEMVRPHFQCQCAINVVYVARRHGFHWLVQNHLFACHACAARGLGRMRGER